MIVNKIIINPRNNAAFPSSGRELINVPTCLRILGLILIVLSGLSTRKSRSAFKFIPRFKSSMDLKKKLKNS